MGNYNYDENRQQLLGRLRERSKHSTREIIHFILPLKVSLSTVCLKFTRDLTSATPSTAGDQTIRRFTAHSLLSYNYNYTSHCYNF